MSLTAAQMDWFAAHGLSLADAAEFVRLGAGEGAESSADRRRRLDRERKRLRKSAEFSAESAESKAEPVPQNSAGNSAEIPPPRERVLDKPLTKVLTGSVVVVDARAGSDGDDWPKAKNLVSYLVEQIESPWLDPSKSPDLIQTGARILAWKQGGASWEHDVIPVIRTACIKAREPIGRWSYFDRAIGKSIAENRKALEIPEARQTGPPGGTIIDRITADNNEARRRVLSG